MVTLIALTEKAPYKWQGDSGMKSRRWQDGDARGLFPTYSTQRGLSVGRNG